MLCFVCAMLRCLKQQNVADLTIDSNRHKLLNANLLLYWKQQQERMFCAGNSNAKEIEKLRYLPLLYQSRELMFIE